MKKSRNISGNSSFVSIRYAPSNKVVPNANEREDAEIPVIDIAGLRNITRIVETIKQKIAAGERNGPGNNTDTHAAGDPSGTTNTGSNCSENTNQEENR
jgi:hypothetical protein